MKKFFFFLVVLILTPHVGYSEETVRLTNGEWPPYLSEKLKHYGIASRIVTEAFALEGIQVDYGFFPWKRSYKIALDGKWDGSLVWSWTEERGEGFYFSGSVIELKEYFFYRKDKPFDWKTYDDLKNVRIGASLGYYYGNEFEGAAKSGKIMVERVATDETNLKKLLKGRIDLFVCAGDVAYSLLQKNFEPLQREQLTHHPKPTRITGYSLLLSKRVKRNKELIKRFNKGLKRLREMGRIEQIMKDI